MADKTRTSRIPTDLASLLLRLTVGPMIFTHGYNKVFGKGGLKGTTGWFDALGLKPAHVHARMAAATEMGSGTLITLGAASPLPAAAVVGLMATAARTDHRGKGFFVFKGGWEYVGVVGVVATVMAAMGPGRISVDAARGKHRSGVLYGLFAAVMGVASAAGLLAASYRPDTKPEDDTES